ncbi:flagellar biosynthesis protein FlhB [Thermodesulfobacteriota bacterium]
MPGDDGSEKTERATERRRREAREKGQVAKSTEVNTLLMFGAGLIALNFFALVMLGHFREMLQFALSNCATFEATELSLVSLFGFYLTKIASILGPLFAIIVVAAILANAFQVGFMISTKPLVPDFSKTDPIKGLKNMFSKHKVGDLVKGVLKIFIIGYIAYRTVMKHISEFPALLDQSVAEILLFIVSMMFEIMFNVVLLYIIIAILDYAFQRWQYEENLKMTKQEVKEEYKQQEGDPLIKSRIRAVQREMARKRMMKDVEKAEVVITNPIHLAVALKYDVEKMDSPMVVAKGARLIAEKIKELAREHNVPIVEDKPLAQALFKKVEIGEFVPMDLYKSVAEILAYVYKISAKFRNKYKEK